MEKWPKRLKIAKGKDCVVAISGELPDLQPEQMRSAEPGELRWIEVERPAARRVIEFPRVQNLSA